ncbi:MAG: gliding motility protein GldM [Taibaiella sp.]|nr:gliding motility protein GldM [Taibaiella sp.]
MSMPKEPRQLMINLMYLVLTALLALNVSNEILHAFKVINQSISKSNSSIEDKNTDLYKQIEANLNQPGQREKVLPFKQKADMVKAASDSMYNFLEVWKGRIIDWSGGKDEEGNIKREDNIDATTLLLVERKGGDTIKSRIQDLRSRLLGMLSEQDRNAIANQLPIKVEEPKKSDNNPTADWKVGFFHNMPTIAAVTLFSKFQNDVRNSEAQIVAQLFSESHQTELKFDELQAVAVPKTTYALEGQKIEGTILMAAYNASLDPKISASEGHVTKTEKGVAYWETQAHGVGLKTVRGTVTLQTATRTETKPFEFQYMVGTTGASMQFDKMNVFYIGVPNPVTISAAGYSLEDVVLNVPGATITPGPAKGQFIIMVTQPGEINASIMAKDKSAGGGAKPVGAVKVRVKFIPDPVAQIAGKTSGGLQANIFKVQAGVIAALKNFDFDARFVVTSFSFSMLPKHADLIGPYNITGARFDTSREIQEALRRAKPGDKVFIEEITARGPDGKTRHLDAIALTLL